MIARCLAIAVVLSAVIVASYQNEPGRPRPTTLIGDSEVAEAPINPAVDLLEWAKRYRESLVSRSSDHESTATLLTRIRAGDDQAREELAARFLPILKRWARGRLPVQARSLADTDDLVQVSLLRALNNIDTFEAGREGDFLAYMRRTLLNAVRDEVRRPANRSIRHPLDDTQPQSGPSHLEEVIGGDELDSYEAALADLTEPQQHAVILRIEFGYTHAQVAEALGLTSSDAARMLAARAVVKLADALREHGSA